MNLGVNKVLRVQPFERSLSTSLRRHAPLISKS